MLWFHFFFFLFQSFIIKLFIKFALKKKGNGIENKKNHVINLNLIFDRSSNFLYESKQLIFYLIVFYNSLSITLICFFKTFFFKKTFIWINYYFCEWPNNLSNYKLFEKNPPWLFIFSMAKNMFYYIRYNKSFINIKESLY